MIKSGEKKDFLEQIAFAQEAMERLRDVLIEKIIEPEDSGVFDSLMNFYSETFKLSCNVADAYIVPQDLIDTANCIIRNDEKLSLKMRSLLLKSIENHVNFSLQVAKTKKVMKGMAALEYKDELIKLKCAELDLVKSMYECTAEKQRETIDAMEKRHSIDSVDQQEIRQRTSKACEAALETGVERWKKYAVVIAKVAYQCGLEDRGEVTRTKFKELAKSHGGLSSTALNLLRDALPEVAKTTPGASRQG